MGKSKIIDNTVIDGFADSAGKIGLEAAPRTLFHYTSADVASEIFKNQVLWNTHILDMRNDLTEFSHGLDLFKEGLTALEENGLDKTLSQSLQGFIDKEKKNPHAPPGIFCLSSLRDDRGQWEKYGDKGEGVCIGFASSTFVEARNVIYDVSRQKSIVEQVNRELIASVEKLRTNSEDLSDRRVIKALSFAYFRVAYMQSLRFKSPGWIDEVEWRGVVLGRQEDLKTYSENQKSKRYYEVGINLAESVQEILLGPKFNSPTTIFRNFEENVGKCVTSHNSNT